MLHLVFGFLEWYESDDSRQAHLAPLISMPVALERVANKRGFVEFSVEYSGEDIQSNLSLVEKMRRDFGLELPLLEDDDTPESYFAKFEDILRLKTTWKVRSQMSLALLSFGKLLMYRDLDPKTWPAGESLTEHPLVRGLFEGSKQSGVEFSEEYLIDAPELKAEVPLLIRDADSFQHSALIDALRGRNLVIEGPPGTGKSQTITNLIAAALAKGKTVLFVSEKLAALEVVRKWLDEVDLGAFCFEVHSHKTKKGELLHDLSRRCALRGTLKDPNALDQHLFIVEQRKQALIRHASLIHTIVDPFGSTVFDILWTCDCSRQVMAAHQERLRQLFLPVLARHTQTDFTQTEQFLAAYSKQVAAILASCDGVIDRHPWAWLASPLGFEEQERLLRTMEEFRLAVQQAQACCRRLNEDGGFSVARTVKSLEGISKISALISEPEGILPGRFLAACRFVQLCLRRMYSSNMLRLWMRPGFGRGFSGASIKQLCGPMPNFYL